MDLGIPSQRGSQQYRRTGLRSAHRQPVRAAGGSSATVITVAGMVIPSEAAAPVVCPHAFAMVLQRVAARPRSSFRPIVSWILLNHLPLMVPARCATPVAAMVNDRTEHTGRRPRRPERV